MGLFCGWSPAVPDVFRSFDSSTFGPVGSLWGGAVVLSRHPGCTPGYHKWISIADCITNIVYRGHLGYIPEFRVHVHHVGCKTDLLSSAGNITHSTYVVLILLLGVLLGV